VTQPAAEEVAMPRYVITAVFGVRGGNVPLGPDVLATAWGRRHRFSYCDGWTLTLVVEQPAEDQGEAVAEVLSWAELLWHEAAGQALPAPSTLRVQTVVLPTEAAVTGPARCGPDAVIAASLGRRVARLRATRQALVELDLHDHPVPPPGGRPIR
jgi:hypothetical protein